MTGLRRIGSFGISLALALTLGSCSDSSPTAPTETPAQVPSPTPSPATFAVSGTVSETPPTTSRRVEGVLVSVSGGQSATTDAEGVFTIAGVASGPHTLTASRSDYETTTAPIDVMDSDLSGIQLSLAPSPRIVDVEYKGSLAPEDPSCHGNTKPCDRYEAGAHDDGTVRVFLVWESSDADLDVELRCNGEIVDESAEEGGTIEEMISAVPGGQACEVFVLLKGAATEYGIFITFPY